MPMKWDSTADFTLLPHLLKLHHFEIDHAALAGKMGEITPTAPSAVLKKAKTAEKATTTTKASAPTKGKKRSAAAMSEDDEVEELAPRTTKAAKKHAAADTKK